MNEEKPNISVNSMIKQCLVEAGMEESNIEDINKIYPLLTEEIGGQVMGSHMAIAMTMYAVACIMPSPRALEALVLGLRELNKGTNLHTELKKDEENARRRTNEPIDGHLIRDGV